VLEASDGVLTSAGICEGLAGAGVASNVLIFAAVTGLVAGGLAMGVTEYSKAAADRDSQLAQLSSERAQLESAPDAELDELTQLYVSRGLSLPLAREVAIELTAHDALQAHAEAELGITPASLTAPLGVAVAAGVAFAAGAAIPLLAMVLIPGPSRALVTLIISLLALGLTGWVAARMSDVHPARPIARTAGTGFVAMAITYLIGIVFHP
jgi:vacuolar iron transporter family protein